MDFNLYGLRSCLSKFFQALHSTHLLHCADDPGLFASLAPTRGVPKKHMYTEKHRHMGSVLVLLVSYICFNPNGGFGRLVSALERTNRSSFDGKLDIMCAKIKGFPCKFPWNIMKNYRHILSCLALLKMMMSFIVILEGEICGDFFWFPVSG